MPAVMTAWAETIEAIHADLSRVVIGQAEVISGVLAGLFCGGHVLLESTPGLGKTLLVKSLSQVLDLTFTRVQCTPTLTPEAIIGTTLVPGQPDTFQPGPLFTHLLLMDELNRSQPDTQSALLEAMGEQQVTVGGITSPMASPFLVLATQNPIEMEGTYPLPQAQLDRFMFYVTVPYPAFADLIEIGTMTTDGSVRPLTPHLDAKGIQLIQAAVRQLPVPASVTRYAARLVYATHPHSVWALPDTLHYLRYGVSPRGFQSLLLGAKYRALCDGRPVVTSDDIQALLPCSFLHRLGLSYEAAATGEDATQLLTTLLASVPLED